MYITDKSIYEVPVPDMESSAGLCLTGVDRYGKAKTYVLPDRSVAFIGAPGFGKSTQLIKIYNQLRRNPNYINVVLDVKGEYLDKCYNPGDKVLSLYDIPGVNAKDQLRWDILLESMLDSHPENVVKKISHMIFDSSIQSSQSPVFPKAAMSVFYGELLYILYEYRGKLHPSTRDVIIKIENTPDSQIINDVKRYEETFGFSNLLAEIKDSTSHGIRMELQTTLSMAFPLGSNFCSPFNCNFSIREFVHEGKGKTLFLVYDLENKDSSENIIKLLLDLSLNEILSGSNLEKNDRERWNFFLDEYAYLPAGLTYLSHAKDLGRSKNLRIYAGFQTYSQLIEVYKGSEAAANNDIAGYASLISFKTHDASTLDLITRLGGTEFQVTTTIDALCNIHTEYKEMPVIPAEIFNELKTGEAVIIPDQGRPFWFKFDK